VNFVADESLDLQIVKRLRQDGHIISYITEIQPGVTDDIVLNLANQEGRVLLTADKDFGELVFRLGRASFGVVLIRLSGLVSSQKAEIVAHAINQYATDLLGSFTVITPQIVRIRRLEF
jgi:predicted nuclease of predicted toxin-antitoxin system